MAGDWIKMRTNLWDDPRVSNLCDLTGCNEAAVIGGLYWLWATADDHSADGELHGLTLAAIARKTGVPNLGAALCQIGWIEEIDGGVLIVRFDDHNGTSAKKRADTAKRVAKHRSNADVTHDALQDEDSCVTGALAREREEKEKNRNVSGTSSSVARASRLSKDWYPSDEEVTFCRTERPDLNVQQVANEFRDYWTARPGKDGTKLDWTATWRNWVRRQRAASGRSPPNFFDERAAVIAGLTGATNEHDDRTIDV